MLNHRVTIGLILIGIWTGSQIALRGDDSIRSPVEAAPRATSQPAAEGAESKADQVVLQLVVVELRGDAQRALKETGFRDSVTGNRFVRGSTERLESDSEALSTVLKSMAIHADVNVLSRPQVRTFLGQSASVQISSTPGRVPYLVRTGTKSFELREADGESPLGIKIDLMPPTILSRSKSRRSKSRSRRWMGANRSAGSTWMSESRSSRRGRWKHR
jgi:hypothetical protein